MKKTFLLCFILAFVLFFGCQTVSFDSIANQNRVASDNVGSISTEERTAIGFYPPCQENQLELTLKNPLRMPILLEKTPTSSIEYLIGVWVYKATKESMTKNHIASDWARCDLIPESELRKLEHIQTVETKIIYDKVNGQTFVELPITQPGIYYVVFSPVNEEPASGNIGIFLNVVGSDLSNEGLEKKY